MSEHIFAEPQQKNTTKTTASLQYWGNNSPGSRTLQQQRNTLTGTFAEPRFGSNFSRAGAATFTILAGSASCPHCPGADSTKIIEPAVERETVGKVGPTSLFEPLKPTGKMPGPGSEPGPGAPGSPGTEPGTETAAPGTATAPVLIVEDSTEELGPGQMKKSEFLAQLRIEVCRAVDEALAGTDRSTQGCPYVHYWFDFYSQKDSGHIERTIHRYAPGTVNARTAAEYIPIFTQKAHQSAEIWARTGEITGIPEGLPMSLPGMDFLGGIGRVIPGIGGLFFKGHSGKSTRSAEDPRVVQQRLGDGSPLEGNVRSRMESAFGMDFSHVRAHTDTKAAKIADDLDSRAFTVGKHVAFGMGEYQPGTPIGDALIAHELAHVVQQGNKVEHTAQIKNIDTDYNLLEDDADQAAAAAVLSLRTVTKQLAKVMIQNAGPRLRSGLRLQRCGGRRPACNIATRPTGRTTGSSTNPPRLTKRQIAPPMETIDCGGYFWAIQWMLDRETKQGGWIVQRIDEDMNVKDCQDNKFDVTTRVSEYNPANYPFWEAWCVDKDSRVTRKSEAGGNRDDSYTWLQGIGEGTRGYMRILGTAEFFEGLSLPNTFRVDKNSPAGELPMTKIDPQLSGGSGAIPHNLKAEWDCCPGSTSHKTKVTVE